MFKHKTAYERRIRDWSSDVCSSDLHGPAGLEQIKVGWNRRRRSTDPVDLLYPPASVQAADLAGQPAELLRIAHDVDVAEAAVAFVTEGHRRAEDRKSTRLNSSH